MKTSSWSEQLRERVAASELAQRLWARYEVAAPREQLAVKILGGFFALLLIVILIVAPLHRYHSEARAEYRQQTETLAWMQANRSLVGTASAEQNRPAGESLLSLANQGARAAGLSFKRSEPAGERGLNVWLEKVSFNQVVAWLGQMERDYGVVASELSASRRDEPGLVDVRLTLQD
ncbi:MAG: type II secretion system protein M [Spongiibacteraceae bacterium]